MKRALLTCLAVLSLAVLLPAAGATRRTLRQTEALGSAFVIADKVTDNTVQYDANDRATSLHRKAVNAFHAGQYETSESCFSLAYNKWPGSQTLIEDYAICTSLYPTRYRSDSRCRQLLKDLQDIQKAPSEKALVARTLLLAREGRMDEARKISASLKTRRLHYMLDDLIPAMIMQNDHRIQELVSRFIRAQPSPAEMRQNPGR